MKNSWFTVPNTITFVRIALTPVLIICMYCHAWLLAGIFMLIASLSDLADGVIARALNQQTNFGALLDAFADKLLMICLLATAIMLNIPELPRWFCAIVLGKELIILGVSTTLLLSKHIFTIAPLFFSKISMAVQMIFFITLFFAKAGGIIFPKIFIWALVPFVLIPLVLYTGILVKKAAA